MKNLTLYQFEECPFCAKVRTKLEEMKIKYKKVNAPTEREDPLRKELLEKSGVHTVPVLKIETSEKTEYIGDSSEIIKFLENNY